MIVYLRKPGLLLKGVLTPGFELPGTIEANGQRLSIDVWRARGFAVQEAA